MLGKTRIKRLFLMKILRNHNKNSLEKDTNLGRETSAKSKCSHTSLIMKGNFSSPRAEPYKHCSLIRCKLGNCDQCGKNSTVLQV